MSTYLIGQIHIQDPAGYQLYAAKVLGTLKEFKGRLVFLSNEVSVLEGKWPFPRTVIMEFENKDLATRWYNSPEYQKIIPLRQTSAQTNIVLIENTLP